MLADTVHQVSITDWLAEVDIGRDDLIARAVGRALYGFNSRLNDYLIFTGIDLDIDNLTCLPVRTAESLDANLNDLIIWTH